MLARKVDAVGAANRGRDWGRRIEREAGGHFSFSLFVLLHLFPHGMFLTREVAKGIHSFPPLTQLIVFTYFLAVFVAALGFWGIGASLGVLGS